MFSVCICVIRGRATAVHYKKADSCTFEITTSRTDTVERVWEHS